MVPQCCHLNGNRNSPAQSLFPDKTTNELVTFILFLSAKSLEQIYEQHLLMFPTLEVEGKSLHTHDTLHQTPQPGAGLRSSVGRPPPRWEVVTMSPAMPEQGV